MTTKILHVSDTHIGYQQYRNSTRREDYLHAFEQALQIACGEHPDHDNDPVDAVLHTGDLFDDQLTSFDDVFACHEALRGLRETNIPFYVIVGNHELRRNTDFVDEFALTGDAIRLTRSPTVLNGEVALYGIDSVRDPDWEDADFSLEPADEGLVRLVAMHQLFTPPLEPIDHDSSNIIDLDPVFDRFGTEVDGVALGDSHERDGDTCRGVPVWYPGATERTGRDKPRPSVDLLTISPEEKPPIYRERLLLDTRKFIEIDIEFGESDTFDLVERRVVEKGPVEDAVVFVDVSGTENGVTKQEILDYLHDRDVVHADVTDERVVEAIAGDLDDIDTESEIDVDAELDDAVGELDIGDEAREIEELLRHADPDLADTRRRANAKERFHELAAERFEDISTEGDV
ncbi:metallophosphoesterase family protein [Halopenitus persicus]|uniref:DNA repair exonuclease SbcCD nuclease subunit n=1 Tax=Halopenitus persicus TaxID=1048396 RepID=A0A1H3LEV9_9EURY|nr:DNA repair exonuclease [Halopenitus persicus]SDY62933.1 DNA repair exonuclease SbcCD nuclease subunit [Halopenitus persicus]